MSKICELLSCELSPRVSCAFSNVFLNMHESITFETVTWKPGYFLFSVTWLWLRHVTWRSRLKAGATHALDNRTNNARTWLLGTEQIMLSHLLHFTKTYSHIHHRNNCCANKQQKHCISYHEFGISSAIFDPKKYGWWAWKSLVRHLQLLKLNSCVPDLF